MAHEKIAIVRLRLRVGDHVARVPVRAIPWGQRATFSVDVGGHRHVVHVTPTAAGKGADVRVSYERDGATVAAETERNVKLRHVTPVFADEAAALAVTIIPTRVSIR